MKHTGPPKQKASTVLQAFKADTASVVRVTAGWFLYVRPDRCQDMKLPEVLSTGTILLPPPGQTEFFPGSSSYTLLSMPLASIDLPLLGKLCETNV